ncbi:MAG: hypothetical protein KAS32_15100 [Candidatus Peribacteraceae bacterium]|nr:hypothetical protein [Candidatus Peribacteraceae bacterium]
MSEELSICCKVPINDAPNIPTCSSCHRRLDYILRECKTCHGKGYIVRLLKRTDHIHSSEEDDCPNLECNNGYMEVEL